MSDRGFKTARKSDIHRSGLIPPEYDRTNRRNRGGERRSWRRGLGGDRTRKQMRSLVRLNLELGNISSLKSQRTPPTNRKPRFGAKHSAGSEALWLASFQIKSLPNQQRVSKRLRKCIPWTCQRFFIYTSENQTTLTERDDALTEPSHFPSATPRRSESSSEAARLGKKNIKKLKKKAGGQRAPGAIIRQQDVPSKRSRPEHFPLKNAGAAPPRSLSRPQSCFIPNSHVG